MIRPRLHLSSVSRTGQAWGERADVLRLDMNELVPDVGEQCFSQIVAKMRPWMLSAYPEVNSLYRKLAAHLGKTIENIVLTAGSDAGIRQTVETFCNPGEKILITHPTYGMYDVYAQIFGLQCIRVEHRPDLSFDVQRILVHLEEDLKLVAIANPNGALGTKIDRAALELVVRKASDLGTVILLDEAYVEFSDDGWGDRIDDFDNLVIARTFSKAAGLAGLRVGYLLSCEMTRSWLYRTKPVVETNALAILAVEHLLENPALTTGYVSGVQEGRNYLSSAMRDLGFEVVSGYANFILVDLASKREAIIAQLAKEGIHVRNYGGDEPWGRFTRITLGPPAVMERVVESVRRAIAFEVVIQDRCIVSLPGGNSSQTGSTDFFENRRLHMDFETPELRELMAAMVRKMYPSPEGLIGQLASDVTGVLRYLGHEKEHDSEGRDLSFAKQSFSNTELKVASQIPSEKIVPYLLYRYRFNHYPRNRVLADFPLLLAIEPTSICNIRCSMCFQMDNNLSRNKSNLGFMSFDLYRRIIDEGAKHGLSAVVLASRGEPTLNKEIGRMIRYAKDAGVLDVKMNTNATMLTADMVREILSSGLDTLVFSVDSAVKKQFELIRVGANFDRIVANIEGFNQIRRDEFKESRTRTRVSMVLIDDSQDTMQAAKFWENMVDEFAYRWAIPRAHIYGLPHRHESRPCSLLWERMYIWFDGTVNPCDEDYLSHLALGRFGEGTSIRDLWLGEKMQEYRAKHLEGQKNMMDPCSSCPGF